MCAYKELEDSRYSLDNFQPFLSEFESSCGFREPVHPHVETEIQKRKQSPPK